MKKEIFTHFIFLVSFFLALSALKSYFNIAYIYFWIGGIIGTILPDIDHIIYIYFLKPQELTSLRAQSLIRHKEVLSLFNLLTLTRQERRELIFHTSLFQLIFIFFSFFILTSVSTIFGMGLVLGFLLHLLIDQVIDFLTLGNINNWLRSLKLNLSYEQTVFYVFTNILLLLVLGFAF